MTNESPLFVRANDGCLLAAHVLKPGDGDSPTLIALHALAMNNTMWAGVSAVLPPGIRVVAIDCRGHGRSDKPAGPYTVAGFAADVVSILDALRLRRAFIAGCSMGGTVALALAGAYPERIAGLSLFDTTAWYGDDAPANWEKRSRIALEGGMSALVNFQLERWFSPEFLLASPQVVEHALAIFSANDTRAYAECCRMLGRADERARMGRYKGPALVAVGENDFATPRSMAEDIIGHMPQAKLFTIPRVRHFTPFEVPEVIAECIRQVITGAVGGVVINQRKQL